MITKKHSGKINISVWNNHCFRKIWENLQFKCFNNRSKNLSLEHMGLRKNRMLFHFRIYIIRKIINKFKITTL
jgi:hypothetical protein